MKDTSELRKTIIRKSIHLMDSQEVKDKKKAHSHIRKSISNAEELVNKNIDFISNKYDISIPKINLDIIRSEGRAEYLEDHIKNLDISNNEKNHIRFILNDFEIIQLRTRTNLDDIPMLSLIKYLPQDEISNSPLIIPSPNAFSLSLRPPRDYLAHIIHDIMIDICLFHTMFPEKSDINEKEDITSRKLEFEISFHPEDINSSCYKIIPGARPNLYNFSYSCKSKDCLNKDKYFKKWMEFKSYIEGNVLSSIGSESASNVIELADYIINNAQKWHGQISKIRLIHMIKNMEPGKYLFLIRVKNPKEKNGNDIKTLKNYLFLKKINSISIVNSKKENEHRRLILQYCNFIRISKGFDREN